MTLQWVALDARFGKATAEPTADIEELMAKYRELPRHIAKKHLRAALTAVIRGGVPILRRNTPPLGTRRGRRRKGEKPASTGDLRRSVTVRSGIINRNTDYNQFAFAVLGYRYGWPSRKAIWLERGTRGGVRAQRMVERTTQEFGKPAASRLADEMGRRFEKAVAEVAGGRNQGYRG